MTLSPRLTRDNRLFAFALACWGMGEGLFIYIQPLYLKELGADPQAIGRILALAALAAGLAHMPAGFLADRFGRKPVLLAGWVLGLTTAWLMYQARDLPLFVLALVGYTFTGFVVAPLNAYVAEARGGLSVQRALTLVSAGFWTGMTVSPALGGLIARSFSLRAVFGAATIAFAVSTLAVLLLQPQPRTPPAPGSSRYGALARNRRFAGFLALIFAAALAMQIGLPLAPLFVEDVRGVDVARVGLLGTANSAGIVALNLLLGQRVPRRGFMLGQACLALSLLLLLTTSGAWLFIAYALRAGWALAHNMGVAQVGRVVGPAETGLAFGITESVFSLAVILGPLVAGRLYAQNPALPFQVSLGLVALTVPLVWWLAPRRDPHTPEAAALAAAPESALH